MVNKMANIGEIFNVEKGSVQSSKSIEGEYDFITASNDWKKHCEYSHDCEALIFAMGASGSLGRTHYVNGKFISSDLCFILTPKNNRTDELDLKFFYYYFNMFREVIVKQTATGTSKLAINAKNFKEFAIHLPSLENQITARIKIEKAQNKIDKLLNNISELKVLLSQLLYRKYSDLVMDAPFQAMKEVAPIIRRPIEVTSEGSYPELGIRSFGKGTFHKPSLTGLDVGTKRLYEINSGDILFSNVFAWEGAIAVATADDHGRVGSHRFITCLPNLSLTRPLFLWYYFMTPEGLEKISQASPGGAGRNKTLGLTKLENITIPLPTLKQQVSFELLLEKVDKIRQHQYAVESDLKNLITSILIDVF
jgi:type I restriction enzyme S subunit